MTFYRLMPPMNPNERLVLVLHRHWLILAIGIAWHLFLLLLPLITYIILSFGGFVFPFGPVSYPLTVLGISMYYLLVSLFFLSSYMDYTLDIWLVTNDRILNIEQKGLFARVISEKKLYRVQDITSEVKGVWQTLFHYGDVFIQTAGEKQRFIFKQVPNAREVAKKIIHLLEQNRENPYYHPEQTLKEE